MEQVVDSFVLTTPAEEQPVSLEEAKDYLKISYDDRDGEIEGLIETATSRIEDYLGFDIIQKGYTAFPECISSSYLLLEKAYLKTDSAEIKVLQNGEFESFEAFYESLDKPYSVLCLEQNLPVADDKRNPYKIEGIFGLTDDADAVPKIYKTAICEMVNFLIENKGACCETDFPPFVKTLLSSKRLTKKIFDIL